MDKHSGVEKHKFRDCTHEIGMNETESLEFGVAELDCIRNRVFVRKLLKADNEFEARYDINIVKFIARDVRNSDEIAQESENENVSSVALNISTRVHRNCIQDAIRIA